MALTDESGSNMVMPVSPMYGGGNGMGGFGGDWSSWIILFLIFGMFGGWGNGGFGGGFGGYGNAQLSYDFPWLMNGQQNINANTNSGFRDQMLNSSINNIQSAITTGFGDTALGIAGINQNICQTGSGIQNAINQGFANTNLGMCNGFNGVNTSINGAQNALAQQLYTNQISDLERSFAAQTASTQGLNTIQSQLAQCCCDNRAATADLKYTVATENCADRTSAMQNTRDIIETSTRNTQAILDKLCALELDGVKSQLAQAQRENVGLQNQVNMANMQASQAAQTAAFQQGLNNEVDALYNRLKNCPVPSYSVCNPTAPSFNQGCGCGM